MDPRYARVVQGFVVVDRELRPAHLLAVVASLSEFGDEVIECSSAVVGNLTDGDRRAKKVLYRRVIPRYLKYGWLDLLEVKFPRSLRIGPSL